MTRPDATKSDVRKQKAEAAHVELHVRMYRALEEVDPAERTYRGLLGDCFLIRFRSGKLWSHILIDCGMLQGSPNAKDRMKAIASNIIETCGGNLSEGKPGLLDLVVVTHEHADHISGFAQAADLLLDPAKLKIGKVWMAWTEKPGDPQAEKLRRKFDKSGAAFAALALRLRDSETTLGADVVDRTLYGLDGFMGLAAGPGPDGKPRERLAVRDVFEALGEYDAEYLEPGTVLKTPGNVGLRTFVLGPPRDEKLLFRDRPSTRTPETYLDAPSVDTKQILRFAEGHDPDPRTDSPFAPIYCHFAAKDVNSPLASGLPPEGEVREFMRTSYYGVSNQTRAAHLALERRRIDADWLGAAGALALKMDSDTNNTSLVLAFELPDEDKTIMLFAADAQVGNWQSWHEQKYTENGADTGETATQLLARTRLYKVGHHGSHNATLKEKGLALMTRTDLFAFLSTDEALGKRQGRKGWNMPDPRLYAALQESTRGRILRNDRTYSDADLEKDPELKKADKDFFTALRETALYLEYQLL